jgi:2-dehydro-3-deoxyphosphogluconate aldolase/(4S)-4-hydroxy-2-oxoglutarate aldolase
VSAGIDRLRQARVIAVIRAATSAGALAAANALVEGGITALEITFTTPEADEVIRTLRGHDARPVVGAGTVMTLDEAERAIDAGAEFVVSPGTDGDVVRAALEAEVVALPGALTPTEIMAARRLGCQAIKLFPASLGGTDYLRALAGPFPDLMFVPTGGITEKNIPEWFAAGALAVGAGTSLCAVDDTTTDLAATRERAARFAAAAATVSTPP